MSIQFIKKGGIDTSDATAVPGDLAKNKTAYVDNVKITGKLENKSNAILAGSVTTSSSAVTFGVSNISPGYYYPSGGSVRVKANNSSLASAIGLTPEKIKKDETIIGVTGTYEGGGGTSFPPDWSLIGYETTPQSIIDDFNYSKNIYDNWDNSITSMNQMFMSNKDLQYMPLVDTSNVSNMIYAFNNATHLKFVPLLNTSNVTSMVGMMGGCTELVTIPAFDTSKVTNMNSAFGNNYKLSNESLNNILLMCANATNYEQTKQLKTIGLSQAQATTCQGLSNYQAFLDAGWTTGY